MTGSQFAVRMNDGHYFPAGGLVDVSRNTYQRTPLAVGSRKESALLAEVLQSTPEH